MIRRHRNRKPSIAAAVEDLAKRGLQLGAMAVMTSARRAASSARPTQLAKLLDLGHCKFLLNCLPQRLPLGERQA